jgi:hypothetical protein
MLWKSQIGRIATAMGYVKATEVADAVDAQDLGIEKPLGRILLQLGALTEEQLNEVIDARDSESADWKILPRIRLENLLFATSGVRKGHLSDMEVAIALKKTEGSSPPTTLAGEFKAAGVLSEKQIDEILLVLNREDLICSLCRHSDIPARVLKEGALPVCDRCGGEYRIVDPPLVEAPTLTKNVLAKADTRIQRKPKGRRKSTGVQAVVREKSTKPPPVAPPRSDPLPKEETFPHPVKAPLPAPEKAPPPLPVKASPPPTPAESPPPQPVKASSPAPAKAPPPVSTKPPPPTPDKAPPPAPEKASPPVPAKATPHPPVKPPPPVPKKAPPPAPAKAPPPVPEKALPPPPEAGEATAPLSETADLSPEEARGIATQGAAAPSPPATVDREGDVIPLETLADFDEAVAPLRKFPLERPPPEDTDSVSPTEFRSVLEEIELEESEETHPESDAMEEEVDETPLRPLELGPESAKAPDRAPRSKVERRGRRVEAAPPHKVRGKGKFVAVVLVILALVAAAVVAAPIVIKQLEKGSEVPSTTPSPPSNAPPEISPPPPTKGGAPETPPPEAGLEVTSPGGEGLVRERRIVVQGRCDPAAVTSVTVGGKAVALEESGSFQTDVDLFEGENRLTVAAKNGEAVLDKRTIRVVVDSLSPRITVEDFPPSGRRLTKETRLALLGKVEDAHPGRVAVGGANCPVDEQGRFRADVPLEEGENRVHIRAVDRVGNESTRPLVVVRDTTPPVIRLEAFPAKIRGSNPRWKRCIWSRSTWVAEESPW